MRAEAILWEIRDGIVRAMGRQGVAEKWTTAWEDDFTTAVRQGVEGTVPVLSAVTNIMTLLTVARELSSIADGQDSRG